MPDDTQSAARPQNSAPEKNEVRGQPIFLTLTRLHGGRLPDQLQVALTEIVRDVVASRRPGSLTLELKVELLDEKKRLTGRETIITASIKQKFAADASAAVFYFDDEGGLHNTDPYQRDAFSLTKK